MADFNIGDKVRIKAEPKKWPACTEFTLLDAEGTVDSWVDWPEVMDPFSEYIYVMIDKADSKGKMYEGTAMLFHEDTLEKISRS